jgi:anti-anti-sigma factor
VGIETRIIADVVIVDLSDGLMSGITDELTKTVTQLLDQGHRTIVLNFERVSLLDSAALGAIVGASAAVKHRGGTFRVEGLNQRLQEEFGLSKLTRLFESRVHLFVDPFNPRLRDIYWKAGVATGSLILVVIVLMIIWSSR